jgi:signal transduction histidine kinase
VRIQDTSEGAADMLSERTLTAIYRIAQEAINNAVKHAAPRRIEVRIESTPSLLKIVVTDDGSGCVQADPQTSGGIGHMHTRAALIGAQLRIGRSSRKGGTRVAIDVPLAGETISTGTLPPDAAVAAANAAGRL